MRLAVVERQTEPGEQVAPVVRQEKRLHLASQLRGEPVVFTVEEEPRGIGLIGEDPGVQAAEVQSVLFGPVPHVHSRQPVLVIFN